MNKICFHFQMDLLEFHDRVLKKDDLVTKFKTVNSSPSKGNLSLGRYHMLPEKEYDVEQIKKDLIELLSIFYEKILNSNICFQNNMRILFRMKILIK